MFTCLFVSCAAEIPEVAGGVADPKMETSALPSNIGALDEGFDSERLAPEGVTANESHEHHHGARAEPAAAGYTCEHHPEVSSDKPGKCPKCGMDLVPKKPTAASPAAPATPHEGH